MVLWDQGSTRGGKLAVGIGRCRLSFLPSTKQVRLERDNQMSWKPLVYFVPKLLEGIRTYTGITNILYMAVVRLNPSFVWFVIFLVSARISR